MRKQLKRNISDVKTADFEMAELEMPELEMPDFDVAAFVTKLDGMGMKLTAIPLADGRFRVSRWCLLNANEHTQQIDDLWNGQIGDDQKRIDVLAAHLAKMAPRDTARISSGVVPLAAAGQE